MKTFARFEKLFEEELKRGRTIKKDYEYMIPSAVNSSLFEIYRSFDSIPENDADALEWFSKIDAKNFHAVQLCFSELQEKYFNAQKTSEFLRQKTAYVLYLRDFFDKITEFRHGSVIINENGSDFQSAYNLADALGGVPIITIANPINGSYLYDFINYDLFKAEKPVYIVYAGRDWMKVVEKLCLGANVIVLDIALLSKGTQKEIELVENNEQLLQKLFVVCRNKQNLAHLPVAIKRKVVDSFNAILLNDYEEFAQPVDSEIPVTSLWLVGNARKRCQKALNDMRDLIAKKHKGGLYCHGTELLLEQTVILLYAIMLEDMELYYFSLLSKLFVYIQFKDKFIKKLCMIQLCHLQEILPVQKTLQKISYDNSIKGNVLFFENLQKILKQPKIPLVQLLMNFLNMKIFGSRSRVFKDLYKGAYPWTLVR